MIDEVDFRQIEADLCGFVRQAYPNMVVRVERWAEDPSRIALFFIEERFESLYPRQRYHYLIHLIPKEFYDSKLAEAVWFELAPGESPGETEDDPDDEYISEIAPDVMATLQGCGFFRALDELFSPADGAEAENTCAGDFAVAKQALKRWNVEEADWSDVFHVLMDRGAFCDCEILYNAAPESRLRSQHWMRVADQVKHESTGTRLAGETDH